MIRIPWFTILMSCIVVNAEQAQSTRSLINDGNGLYKDGKYDKAEVDYRKALEKEQGSLPAHFNLGNSLSKQKKVDQSIKEFETAATSSQEKETKAHAMYNTGNSYLEGGQYDSAVKSYIEALKQDPGDEDAKYNLSYALRKMKDQKQQNQQQNKKDQNQQQKQQQNKQQGNKNQNKDQNKNDNQNPQQKNQNQPGQQQDKNAQNPPEQQPKEKQMSRADADRILEVLKNNEKNVQKKLRVKARARPKTDKDW